MEILSPAGSPEGLVASIKGGCDAVYLGGKLFGARAFSDNFTDQELEGAINYAHDNNVKVYVTVNTLIKDSEMADAVSYVKYLYDLDADAVLIQDLGLLKSLYNCNIEKHASTQMGIHSAAGLEWCSKNDIDRAVLSRELTFDELEEVVKGSPIDTEVFVQGSMCYCISGGCLFSSVAGGRSGNRGQCAQPCRKKYTMGNRSGYILSSADLYGVEWLGKLESIGIKAVKIEGRMRSQAYAYLATKVYSSVNRGVPLKDMNEDNDLLKTVFNRGFCEGYLGGVVSPVQMKYADNRGFLLGQADIVDRKFDADLLYEKADIKDGISIFRGEEKVGGFKLPNTGRVTVPFKLEDGEYDIYRTYDPRIDGVKNLIGPAPKFTGTKKRSHDKHELKQSNRIKGKKPQLSFYVNSLKNLEIVLNHASRVYFDRNEYLQEAKNLCRKANVECVTNLPRFDPRIGPEPDGSSVMANSPDQFQANIGNRVYGSYHMNMFNSDYPETVFQNTLSVELSKTDIESIAKHYPGRLEVMVFGRTELMCTRDPGMCNGIMTDEKEFRFPVYRDSNGLSHFLNSSDLLLLPYLKELQHIGIDSLGIDLRKRPSELAKIVSEAYANNDVSKKGKITEMCGSINYGAYLHGTN